ncbi:MAG: bifunctional 5,10-methylenetetrahydrofolate dehydrogenase/5,10-methenyltetrahydrofolate cyclohydrolase [Elusimicrobia bacterium]|nr:bifunctional 5,10-methylenetetrahydrofolate dehydrogenase/5,10-methenyltetrahydrofolate cyclohydrolase [Elusimicrobiota bacterium]MBU2614321.1 bifunctional 5,10-methylenetetrahydrofolate dehydrogenase/5,10-methenyltetrahydrofolate cyclohydrolase [Elusimicrobiota bacterium]
MAAQLIDGNKIADKIKNETKSEIAGLSAKLGKKPFLTAIQIGKNAASSVYVKNQKSSCEELGIDYRLIELPQETDERKAVQTIKELNSDNSVNGIILQMPVPPHINARNVLVEIAPEKDIEGITPLNLGKLLYAGVNPVIAPCAALSVIECLKSIAIELKGKETVIVGHSEIVGKPILLMLLSSLTESLTPTVCHIATKNLASHTLRADILIVAVGKASFIKGNMIKEGAIVIDVGINRIKLTNADGNPVIDEKSGKPKMKTVGDVDFEKASKKASFITPVPGGVGAVTTVLLMKNLLHLWKQQSGDAVSASYKIL